MRIQSRDQVRGMSYGGLDQYQVHVLIGQGQRQGMFCEGLTQC